MLQETAPRPTHLQTALGGLGTVLGPAFVAAVAYVDPGNFATNLSAGSRYGYLLVWVVLASNLMAMLIQYLSAKTGIATGMSLPELCRREFGRVTVRLLWLQAELVAVATDLAEVVGGAVALELLFGLPLLIGGVITALASFAVLGLKSIGRRPFEAVITGLLGVILAGFLYSVARGGFRPGPIAAGVLPRFAGSDSVLLAASMLGATVMPHVIYLHSKLTAGLRASTSPSERKALLRYQKIDVVTAMTAAGVMNLALLVIAATTLRGHGDTIEAAHSALSAALGAGTALLFACTLLASGLASSSVGTLAGEVIMAGFLRRRIPLVARRLITLTPALLVLATGVDATRALVASQVVLSLGIPFALVPLIMFTRRRDIMGSLVNRTVTTVVGAVVAAVIIVLNVELIVLTIR